MAGRHTRNHDYVLTTRSAPGSPSRYSIVFDILFTPSYSLAGSLSTRDRSSSRSSQTVPGGRVLALDSDSMSTFRDMTTSTGTSVHSIVFDDVCCASEGDSVVTAVLCGGNFVSPTLSLSKQTSERVCPRCSVATSSSASYPSSR